MKHSNKSILSVKLIETVRAQVAIDWQGIHGMPHWARVYQNGMRLARATDANLSVVELFALFHDSCRLSEGNDPHHGPRAAQLAYDLHGELFRLKQHELDLLQEACHYHTAKIDHENMTVKTCFDADRLDLGRVGDMPNPKLLCTDEGKKPATISWAYQQSLAATLPENILTSWYSQTLL